MNNLNPCIKNELDFVIREYCPSNSSSGILSEMDVLKAHFILADFFISMGEEVQFGILNYDMLSSAVARQDVGLGGIYKWPDAYSKVATLAFGLDKNHAFKDGNKRTALLCMLLALHRIKRRLNCNKKELETLLVRVAANEMYLYKDFHRYKKHGDDAVVVYMADFLRRNSQRIDNSYKVMTYEEFNSKLRPLGVRLANPDGSYIDVLQRPDEKRRWFGLKQNKKEVRRLQIGFPGWKRQINIKAVKSVLTATQLTPENGIDFKSFYDGSEPEYKLIDEYFDILKRLKDK